MTYQQQLSRTELFEGASPHAAVSTFLGHALARGKAVRLSLAEDGGTLSLSNRSETASMRVQGRWRASEFKPTVDIGTGGNLILPLVFYVREIQLNAGEIVTFGYEGRPVADLFARSLFRACLRGTTINWEAGRWFRPDLSRAFAERYLALLSESLTEPAFAGARKSECLDLALAALSIGRPVFENPLLRIGAHQLYEAADRNALRRAFRSARSEVLKVVAP